MNWYVIYTRSRFEKKTEDLLIEKGFEAYCPKRTIVKQWSDRKKQVVEPLFRSYIFVKINESQKYDVLNTSGVVKFVNFKGEMAQVREEEIDRIKALLNEYDHESIKIESLEPNQLVTIASGAFMDQEGIVLKSKGHKSVIYLIELGLKIEVDHEKNIIKKSTNIRNNRTLEQQTTLE